MNREDAINDALWKKMGELGPSEEDHKKVEKMAEEVVSKLKEESKK